ncbi:MAG: hypothetical protein LBH17_07235 [Oscillospiraceae bacterium]|jgi:hypothetical protein|nr:hypothetical protein [Oscillospiraceae bacterium]
MSPQMVVLIIIGVGTFVYGRLEKKGIIKPRNGVLYTMPILLLGAVIFYVVRENDFKGNRPPDSIEAELFVLPFVAAMFVLGVFRLWQSAHLRRKMDKLSLAYKSLCEEEGFSVEQRIRSYKILGYLYLICAGLIGLIMWRIVPFLWAR